MKVRSTKNIVISQILYHDIYIIPESLFKSPLLCIAFFTYICNIYNIYAALMEVNHALNVLYLYYCTIPPTYSIGAFQQHCIVLLFILNTVIVNMTAVIKSFAQTCCEYLDVRDCWKLNYPKTNRGWPSRRHALSVQLQ